jgi:signal transduction histidine kinase
VDLREDLAERDIRRRLLQSLDEHQSVQREIRRSLSDAQEHLFRMRTQQAAMAGAMTVVRAAEHEINNINMVFSGYSRKLESLQKKIAMGLSKENAEELEKIHRVMTEFSLRLKGYAEFITSFSKKIDEPVERKIIDDLINDGLNDLKEETDLSKIRIEKQIQPGAIIDCYPREMRHAFYQIFKNSAEAMPGGGVLAVGVSNQGSGALITIRDNGKGIDGETAPMVFIPLFTQTKIYGGKGSSIAHRIICDNHKGDIRLESYTAEMIKSGKFPGRNRGTVVTIEIPIEMK